MARLRYYPTPADFAIGFGESVPLLDADGVTPISGDPVGRLAAVPSASVSFEVCTSDDYVDVTTDLLDGEGGALTVWSTSEDFITLGRGPILQGPDNHVGPLYLTPDAGTTFYRIEPDSTEVYARLAAAEATLAGLTTGDLTDFDLTDRADGKFVKFDNGLGKNVYADPAGTGTVTSVNTVAPVDGDVTLTPANVGAATAAQASSLAALVAVLQQSGYVYVPWTGSGYASKPAGFAKAIRIGPTAPTSQNADGDLYFQPEEEEV